MAKDAFVIVWSESKTEGVIFRNNFGDSGEDDALHAANIRVANPYSALGEAFLEVYGESDDVCFIQEITIDTSKAVVAEDF